MRRTALTAALTLALAAPAYAESPHQAAPDGRPLADAAQTFLFGKVERHYHRLLDGNVTSYAVIRCGPSRCVSLVAYGEGYGDYLMVREACRVKGVKVICRARSTSEYLTPAY